MYIVILVSILIVFIVLVYLLNKRTHKYYWLIDSGNVRISEGYYSYIPNVRDTIYYYIIKDSGEEISQVNSGIVQKVSLYSYKQKIYIYITIK